MDGLTHTKQLLNLLCIVYILRNIDIIDTGNFSLTLSIFVQGLNLAKTRPTSLIWTEYIYGLNLKFHPITVPRNYSFHQNVHRVDFCHFHPVEICDVIK